MTNILPLLREKGFKVTPQRRAVIEALSKCDNFSTAQQIAEYVKKTNPEMSLDTVYRNLNLFADIGVLNRINVPGRDGNAFELAQDHHHHLVCLGCGKIQCLKSCPIQMAEAQQAAAAQDFAIVNHSLEFYGYCRNCKES